jgi:drug/metabolite transporter (DMT)-like permease
MTLSALAFASNSVAIKPLASLLPTPQIIMIHFLTGILVLGPILFLRGSGLRGNPAWVLVLRGLCGTFSFFFFLRALNLIPLSSTIVLFCAYPIFVAVFSWLLFKTTTEKKDLLLIFAGVTGATILINPSFCSFNLGYIFALLSGAMEAMGIVIVAKARQTNNPFIIHFYFCVTGGMLCLPFAQGFRMPDADGGFLLAFSALASLVGQVLMNQGLKFCKPTEGSLILMSEVVFAGAGGILIFKDPVTANFLVGALLVVVSGVGLNLVHRSVRNASGRENVQPPAVKAREG